jgi:hypothetical protein
MDPDTLSNGDRVDILGQFPGEKVWSQMSGSQRDWTGDLCVRPAIVTDELKETTWST